VGVCGLNGTRLDWIGLMRGAKCKIQDTKDAGSAGKDQAGMKGANRSSLGGWPVSNYEWLRGREIEKRPSERRVN
jgi:hypothetical protein